MSAEAESTDCRTDGIDNGSTNGIEKRTSPRPHLLVVPLVTQASAGCAVRLGTKLASRGVIVTFAMIKPDADQVLRTYSRESLQALGINIEVLDEYQPPSLPFPLFQTKQLKAAFQPFLEKLIADKKAGLPGPTCIIADGFLPWTEDVANELDIPRYTFVCHGAITVRLMQSYHEKGDELKSLPNGSDWKEKSFELLRQQPGLRLLKAAADIPNITLDNGWADFYCHIGRSFTSSNGIVLNSFYALEHLSYEDIRNAYPGSNKFKVPPIFAVGPLSTAEGFKNVTLIKDVEDSHAECVEWLGAQPSKSVLYICLGSAVRLFGEQILHLARALDESQCRFLWVLTKGGGNFDSVEEVLPHGYLERVRGRGKIVTGWVGQVELLSNPAVVGFLSHCGWQSTIETVSCGVPVIGWPQGAEQRLNCRYIQQVLKLGVRISEKVAGQLVEQHEFEEAIKTLMFEKEGTVMAANAAKMKSMAAEAVAVGGPSDVALDQLIELFSNRSRRN